MAAKKRAATPAVDDRIDKRRVTMTTYIALPPADDDPERKPRVAVRQAVDYVPPEILDAYVADARERWQQVEVSEEPDAGPAGYDGPTFIPAHLPVPDAGTFRGEGS